MKRIDSIIKPLYRTALFACASMLAVLLLQNCSKSGGATPATPVETNTKLLTSTVWKIQNVAVDGIDKTASFSGMTLLFSLSNYSTTAGNLVWPANGTWTFTDATATAFTRNDGVQVQLKSISATSLQLGLTWTKTTLGQRTSSVAGQYVFTFSN